MLSLILTVVFGDLLNMLICGSWNLDGCSSITTSSFLTSFEASDIVDESVPFTLKVCIESSVFVVELDVLVDEFRCLFRVNRLESRDVFIDVWLPLNELNNLVKVEELWCCGVVVSSESVSVERWCWWMIGCSLTAASGFVVELLFLKIVRMNLFRRLADRER